MKQIKCSRPLKLKVNTVGPASTDVPESKMAEQPSSHNPENI